MELYQENGSFPALQSLSHRAHLEIYNILVFDVVAVTVGMHYITN